MRIQMRKHLLNLVLVTAAIVLPTAVPARADDLAYAVASAEIGRGNAFGIMNLTTGTFTLRGYTGAAVVGLGEFRGTLYATGAFISTLYKVNPANGSLTVVGSGSTVLGTFGSTTTGLFALDYSMNLYSVDPATGASTFIGSTGLPAAMGASREQ